MLIFKFRIINIKLTLCLSPKANEHVNNSLPPKKRVVLAVLFYILLYNVCKKDNYLLSMLERTRGKMHKYVHFTRSKVI